MKAVSFRSVSKVYIKNIKSHFSFVPRHKQTSLDAHSLFKAVDDVSFDIEMGDFFGLLGPNGAGKTTLISMLAGLSRISSGNIHVMGHDVQKQARQARFNLGVVPQELVFDPFFTVREALIFQSGYYGIKKNDVWIDEILHNLGLNDKANANMRQLSGGMKRRVLVGLALVHKPAVVVLDEPTAGVDVELRQSLWQFIAKLNRQGTTILLTTHYLEEAEALCNRIAMLKNGKIITLANTSDLLKATTNTILRFKLNKENSTLDELPPLLQAKTRMTGRIAQIPVHDHHQIEQYLALLRQANVAIDDIEVRKADLEDIFLNMVGSQPSDNSTNPNLKKHDHFSQQHTPAAPQLKGRHHE